MNIYVINKSTVLKDAQIERWIPAFDVFAGHVREWWPRSVSLVWCARDKEPELAWKLVFADKSDEAGDLGYHDFTPDGRPISYVFAADLKEAGASVTVTATHEIAEMIADPWISENFQITDTRFFAKEICDPCEDDQFAYSIKAGGVPSRKGLGLRPAQVVHSGLDRSIRPQREDRRAVEDSSGRIHVGLHTRERLEDRWAPRRAAESLSSATIPRTRGSSVG